MADNNSNNSSNSDNSEKRNLHKQPSPTPNTKPSSKPVGRKPSRRERRKQQQEIKRQQQKQPSRQNRPTPANVDPDSLGPNEQTEIESTDFAAREEFQGDAADDNRAGLDNRSEYDQGYIRGRGQEPIQTELQDNRAEAQSTGSKIANAFGQLTSTIPKAIQQTGNSLNPQSYFAPGEVADNDWNKFFDGVNDYIREDFAPIYRHDPGETLDIDDPAYYLQTGSSLVSSVSAFAASGYALGGGMKGASMVARAFSAGSKAQKAGNLSGKVLRRNLHKVSNYLKNTGRNSEIGRDGLQDVIQRIGARSEQVINGAKTMGNAVLLNRAEGLMEGTAVYDEAYNRVRREGGTHSRAVEEASSAASTTVSGNQLNVALQLTSAARFLQKTRGARSAPVETFRQTGRKAVGYETAQEAAEEVVNLGARGAGMSREDGLGMVDDAIEEALSLEGFEAAAMGAVGGAGQTFIQNQINKTANPFTGEIDQDGKRVSQATIHDRKSAERAEQARKVDEMQEAADVRSKSDVLQTAEEVAQLNQKIAEAEDKGDKKTAQEYRETLFSHQVFKAMERGALDELERFYTAVNEMDETEAETRGLDVNENLEDGSVNPNYYKRRSDQALRLMNQLEADFDYAKEYYNSDQVFEKKSSMRFMDANMQELDNRIAEVRKQVHEDAERLRKSINEDIAYSIDHIDENTETLSTDEEYQKQHRRFRMNLVNSESFIELRELQNDRETLENQRNAAEKQYKKLTSKEEQEKAFKRLEEQQKINERKQQEPKRQAEEVEVTENNTQHAKNLKAAEERLNTLITDYKRIKSLGNKVSKGKATEQERQEYEEKDARIKQYFSTEKASDTVFDLVRNQILKEQDNLAKRGKMGKVLKAGKDKTQAALEDARKRITAKLKAQKKDIETDDSNNAPVVENNDGTTQQEGENVAQQNDDSASTPAPAPEPDPAQQDPDSAQNNQEPLKNPDEIDGGPGQLTNPDDIDGGINKDPEADENPAPNPENQNTEKSAIEVREENRNKEKEAVNERINELEEQVEQQGGEPRSEETTRETPQTPQEQMTREEQRQAERKPFEDRLDRLEKTINDIRDQQQSDNEKNTSFQPASEKDDVGETTPETTQDFLEQALEEINTLRQHLENIDAKYDAYYVMDEMGGEIASDSIIVSSRSKLYEVTRDDKIISRSKSQFGKEILTSKSSKAKRQKLIEKAAATRDIRGDTLKPEAPKPNAGPAEGPGESVSPTGLPGDVVTNSKEKGAMKTARRTRQALESTVTNYDANNNPQPEYRIVAANNHVAHLNRNYKQDYDSNGQLAIFDIEDHINQAALDDGKDQTYLVPGNLNPGDEVRFRVDNVTEYGRTQTENLRQQGIEEEGAIEEDFIPIIVERKIDGEWTPFAHLHTKDHIEQGRTVSSDNTNDTIDDIKRLRVIRKKVLKNESLTTNVTQVANGSLAEGAPASESNTSGAVNQAPFKQTDAAIPSKDIEIFAPGYGVKLTTKNQSAKPYDSNMLNWDDLALGLPYTRIPVNYNNSTGEYTYVAIPLRMNRMKENDLYRNSIKKAIEIAFRKNENTNAKLTEEEQAFADSAKNHGYDLTGPQRHKNLQNYLELFLQNVKPQDNASLAGIAAEANDDGSVFVNIQGNTINYVTSGSGKINYISENLKNEEKFQKFLRNFIATIGDVGLNFNADLAGEGMFSFPVFDNKRNNEVTYEDYHAFIRNHSKTPIRALDTNPQGETPQFTYTVHRSVQFDSEQLIDEESLRKASQSVSMDEETAVPATTEEQPASQTTERKKKRKKKPKRGGPVKFAPANVNDFAEGNADNRSLSNLDDFMISGELSARKQSKLINSAASLVYKNVLESGTMSMREAMDNFYEDLNENLKEDINNAEYLSEDQKAQFRYEIDLILNNFAKFEDLVNRRLNQFEGIDTGIKVRTAGSQQYLTPEEQREENKEETTTEEAETENYSRFEEDSRKERNPVNDLGSHKAIFAFVDDFELTEDGASFVEKYTYLGLQEYKDLQEAYNETLRVLAHAPANLQAQLDILEQWKRSYPFLQGVINNLKNAEPSTQNAVVSHFASKRPHQPIELIYDYDRKKQKYTFSILAANQLQKDAAVKQRWQMGLVNSPLTKQNPDDRTDIIVDMDQVEELYNQALEWKKQKVKPGRNEVEPWLDKLGIKLSDDTWEELMNGQMQKGKNRFSWKVHFEGKGGLFTELRNTLNRFRTEGVSPSIYENPIIQGGTVNALANIESKYDPTSNGTIFYSGGKMLTGYVDTDYMSDRIRDLKQDTTLVASLLDLSYNKHSKFLNALYNKKRGEPTLNNLFAQNFDIKELSMEPFKKKVTRKTGEQFKNLTEIEKKAALIGMWQNGGTQADGTDGNKYRVGWMPAPVFADRKTVYGIRQLLTETEMEQDGEGNLVLDEATLEQAFSQLVKPELERIRDTQKLDIPIKGYNEGKNYFFFIPELNFNENFNVPIWNEDGTLDAKATEIGTTQYNELMRVMHKNILEKAQKEKESWRELGIFEEQFFDGNHFSSVVSDKFSGVQEKGTWMATDYTLNRMISDANYYMAFAGDLAQYYKRKDGDTDEQSIARTFDNAIKRLSGETAPGSKDVNAGSKIRFAYIADLKMQSLTSELFRVLPEDQREEYEGVMEGMDAQEFITLKEAVENIYASGQMSESQYLSLRARIKRSKKGETPNLTEKEIALVINPFKQTYNGNRIDKKNNLDRKTYTKSAGFPLIPELTKNSSLDNLRRAMEEQGIDRLAADSAVKVGFDAKPANIWNEDGTVKDASEIDFKNHRTLLPREYLKVQQNNPIKTKGKQKIGTQESKMFAGNMLGVDNFYYNGEYINGETLRQNMWDEFEIMHEEGLKKLENEIADENGNADINKLKKIFDEEAQTRDFSIADLDAIEIEGNQFKVPLWALQSGSRYEAVLNSIVSKRTIRHEMPGQAGILITEEGFKVNESQTAIDEKTGFKNLTENRSEMTLRRDWDGRLKGKRTVKLDEQGNVLFNEDGTEQEAGPETSNAYKKVMPHQVIIPFKFTDQNGKTRDASEFRDSNGFLDQDKFDPELLSMFGFRIPTGGSSFTAEFEVVGFMPKASGDAVIAPRDLTKQMGLDYDNDKLNFYHYNTVVKNGKMRRLDPEQKEDEPSAIKVRKAQDRTLDQRFALHRNPDDRVQRELLRPEDTYGLEEVAAQMRKAREQRSEGKSMPSIIDPGFQSDRYTEIQSSGAGVGVKSNDNVNNSVFQTNDPERKLMLYKDNKEYRIAFAGKESNGDLSDTWQLEKTPDKTNNPQTKAETHRIYQTIHLDHVNEQIAQHINSTPETFAAERALAQLGWDKNDIPALMGQDIIGDYIAELRALNSPFAENMSGKEKAVIAYDRTLSKGKYETRLNYRSQLSSEEVYALENDKIRMSENLSVDEMMKLIEEGPAADNYALAQHALLDKFIEFSEIGDAIQRLQSLVNTDSQQIPSSQFEAQEKVANLVDLNVPNGSMHIQNQEKVIGEYYNPQEGVFPTDPEYKFAGYNQLGQRTYIKPTTINGHATVYGLFAAVDKFSRFFPYNKSRVNEIIKEVKMLRGSDKRSHVARAQESKEIFNKMVSFLKTKRATGMLQGDPVARREELTEDFTEQDGTTNTSLATKVEEIKKTEFGRNNMLVRLLSTGNSRRSAIAKELRFNLGESRDYDDTEILASMMEMYDRDTFLGEFDGKSYYSSDLFKELHEHQMLTGAGNSANNLGKYTSTPFMELMGFAEFMRTMDLQNDSTIFGNRQGEAYHKISTAALQIMQHDIDSVPTELTPQDIGVTDFDGFDVDRVQKFMIDPAKLDDVVVQGRKDKKGTSPASLVLPELVKIQGRLFKLDDDQSYYPIDTLGTTSHTEYNGDNHNVRSVLDPNRHPHTGSTNTGSENPTPAPLDQQYNSQSAEAPKDTAAEQYGLYSGKSSEEVLQDALTVMITEPIDKVWGKLANDFRQMLPGSGIRIELDPNMGQRGGYNPGNNTIYINPTLMKTGNDIQALLTEELIHAFTSESIYANETRASQRVKGILSQLQERYGLDNIEAVMQKVTDGQPLTDKEHFYYRLSNIDEFLAGLTMNQDLIAELKKMEYSSNKSFLQEVMQRILDVLKDIGIDVDSDTAYRDSMASLFETIYEDQSETNDGVKVQVDKSLSYGEISKTPVYSDKGVNTMRRGKNEPNTHFGNPWFHKSTQDTIKVDSIEQAVKNYKDWLMGNAFGDVQQERRKWILEQIDNGYLDHATLLYMNKAGGSYRSHADVLKEIVQRVRDNDQRPADPATESPFFEDGPQVGNASNQSDTLPKKNVFSVTPANSNDQKAAVKASVANKFIGFGNGLNGSSTESYRQQAGQYANTGEYNSSDVIFVSIPGKRGDGETRKQAQIRTISEAQEALGQGATVVVDNKSYTESSNYNEGEKKLAEALERSGYQYSEAVVDGYTLGVYTKPNTETPTQNNNGPDQSPTDTNNEPNSLLQPPEKTPSGEIVRSELDNPLRPGAAFTEGMGSSDKRFVVYNFSKDGEKALLLRDDGGEMIQRKISDLTEDIEKGFMDGFLLEGYFPVTYHKDGDKGGFIVMNDSQQGILSTKGKLAYDSLDGSSQKQRQNLFTKASQELGIQGANADATGANQDPGAVNNAEFGNEVRVLNMEHEDIEIVAPDGPNTVRLQDGTTLELSDDQKKAYDAFDAFMDNPDQNVFTLSGYAGTGKTMLTRALVEKIAKPKASNKVIGSAPTHKAKENLKMLNKDGNGNETLDVKTIQSILGLKANENVEEFEFSDKKFVEDPDKATIQEAGVVIIDEASMVNSDLFDLLMKHTEEKDPLDSNHLKIVFVGDSAQLPPINQKQSRVFEEYEAGTQMTQLMRQSSDTPLMDAFTKLRNNLNSEGPVFEHVTQLNEDGEGIEIADSKNTMAKRAIELMSSEEYKADHNHARVIAWRNDTVGAWNKMIREGIWEDPEIGIHEGETMMAYAAIDAGDPERDPVPRDPLTNSADYKVVEKGYTSAARYGGLGVDESTPVNGYAVKLYNQITDETVEHFIVDPKDETSKDNWAKIAANLFTTAIKSVGQERGKAFAKYYDFTKTYLMTENRRLTPKTQNSNGKVATKSIDYGYAITTHKSQGSTYKTALVDESDMMVNKKLPERNKMRYTALTRPAKNAIVLTNFTSDGKAKTNIEKETKITIYDGGQVTAGDMQTYGNQTSFDEAMERQAAMQRQEERLMGDDPRNQMYNAQPKQANHATSSKKHAEIRRQDRTQNDPC